QSFFGFSRPVVLYPIFDPSGKDFPRNMRIVKPKFSKHSLNLSGLSYLHASGSGQFSEQNLNQIIHELSISPEKFVVFDLRQESHGFINGNPISWTDGNYNYANLHKSRSEIETDEYQRLMLAARAGRIVINPVQDPTKVKVRAVKTERAMVEGLGSRYVRLPVTDHNRPSNQIIDEFVKLIRSLPQDQWIHFHCRAGKGRTTTFLTLLDIMKNAREVSLDDILARQT